VMDVATYWLHASAPRIQLAAESIAGQA
jgi:hypothetical protein